MSERNAAVGYAALKKEATKGTAVTPNVYVPYYKQSMHTDINLIQDDPIVGNRFKHYQNLQGLRSHKGNITVMAEPNTAGYLHDMIATKSSTTGSDPYTHTFGASNTTDPNSYTLDLSFGSQVVRFFGVQSSKIAYAWKNQRMQFEVDLSGLGSFYGREISSISTTTVVLKTEYDASPTTGLVASDLVTVVKADGSSSLNTTISTISDSTTVVLGASAASFAAGDMLVLRAATPSLSLLTPFLWGKTEFRFGATASAALSATQTRLDTGTEITLINEFDDDEGAKRSGAFDPASLVRTTYDVKSKIKKFFDTTEEIKYWNAMTKRALVMRAYSGATSQYELRVTLNNINAMTNEIPTDSGGVIFHEIDYAAHYDTSDSQAFDVKVLNAVSSI
jgi:hypothetical protein